MLRPSPAQDSPVPPPADALGREYYRHGGGYGHRNGYRTARLKSAEEQAFTDRRGHCRLTRTAVSELTERLWSDYQAFAARDLSMHPILYLFVDGIAERVHLGQPREPVLAAWGITASGQKVLLGSRRPPRKTPRAAATSCAI